MAISLQADSTLPQGYILVDGQKAATISTTGLSATLADGLVTTSALASGAVTAEKLPVGSVIQVLQSVNTTVTGCSTLIPYDDSIPLSNEGNEILTATITPMSSSNKILIRATVSGTTDTGGSFFTAAVFKNSNLSAIATGNPGGYYYDNVTTLEYLDTAETTSTITYSVRAGSSAGIFYLNGSYVGTRVYGGALKSTITLMEIKG
jgi:hypothetical protein